jgi:hypothetical protein
MFTIDLNKMVKTEKVMIVIKRSIDIDNMMGWGRGKKSRLRLTGRGGFLRLFCTMKRDN